MHSLKQNIGAILFYLGAAALSLTMPSDTTEISKPKIALEKTARISNPSEHKFDYNPDSVLCETLDELTTEYNAFFEVDSFGQPKIIYKGCSNMGERAYYNAENNILEVYVPREYLFFNKTVVRGILRHEYGHFYADKLAESMGKGSWPRGAINLVQRAGEVMLTEGIGEYFRKLEEPSEADTSTNIWPSTIDEIIDTKYHTGYIFVKPIVSKFGIRGLKELINLDFDNYNITKLHEYQQMVIQKLQNNTQLSENSISPSR